MSEQNLYEQAEKARSLRDQMAGSDQDARDNPYFGRGRKDLESSYPYPDIGFLCDLHQEALWALQRAEERLTESLSSGELIALGYSGPDNPHPSVIPPHHWFFMDADFDNSKARGEGLAYVGIKVLSTGQLPDKDKTTLTDAAKANKPDIPELDPLRIFRDMEGLAWNQVSMALVAGDLIEVAARGKTKKLSYAELGLLDRRTGKGGLNKQGQTLLDMVLQKPSKDPQYSKHLSRLRALLREKFGIQANPFVPSSKSNLHSPVFTLNDFRHKADQRAKERAQPHHVAYEAESLSHQIPSALSDSLGTREEEYPYDPSIDEDDEANRFLNSC